MIEGADEQPNGRVDAQTRTLALFHYLLSVPVGFMSLLSLPLIFAGLDLILTERPGMGKAAVFSGATFLVWAACIVIIAIGMAVCLVLGGKYLMERRNYTFCLAVAGVSCLIAPFGTALGIVTLLFLTKGTTKSLFDRA